MLKSFSSLQFSGKVASKMKLKLTLLIVSLLVVAIVADDHDESHEEDHDDAASTLLRRRPVRPQQPKYTKTGYEINYSKMTI